MMRNNNRACRILLAGALATATSEAFAPLKSSRFISTSNPSLESADTRLSYIINHPTVIDIPTAPPRVLFSVEDLDAEVDAFADPNDKRYSASDWYHNMVSLPNSAILREIKGPVGWIAAWSTLVSVVYKVCHMKGLGHIANKMCLGPTPHSLISSVIGLLLVFRTNSAYQRFKVSPYYNYIIASSAFIYSSPLLFLSIPSFIITGRANNVGATPKHLP